VESSYEQRGSLGLRNMSERTEMVNGIFRIDSAVGKGTTVRVLIPLTPEAGEQLRRGG
jgi:signal transduction histidine kinase